MNAWLTGLVTFACVFGGALAGMALREVLPEHHLSDESRDVVKVVTGLMATLSALVLGLLIASAKSSFDSVNDGFKRSAATIILIDRALAQYGPEAESLRAFLKQAYEARINQLFGPGGEGGGGTHQALRDAGAIEKLDLQIRSLAPVNDIQRSLKSRAEDLVSSLSHTRWIGFEESNMTTPVGFLVVLVSWLVMMFAGFGLFAPRNATAIVALVVGATAVSTSIFLIEEMSRPLDGLIAVPAAPMREAVSVLGK